MTIDWDYTMVWVSARLIDMPDDDAHTVLYARRCFVTIAKIRHGLRTLNSNNFVDMIRNIKCVYSFS